MNNIFRKFANAVSQLVGKPQTFALALAIIFVWSLLGKTFNYSNTWQLFINTTTTIVTFLMVFLIQNTQNRDSKAMHLKLDEILKSIHGARNELVDIEESEDDEIEALQVEFQNLHNKYMRMLERKKNSN